GLEDELKKKMEKTWADRMNSFKERGPKTLPKWDPTAPKVKEVIEARTYDDDDDLLDLEPPSFGAPAEPEPAPRAPSPPPQEEEEEEEEEEEDEEEEEEEE
ncbi:hypothetical protein, partial [Pseudoalteromonas sp. BMB]|uniref:hypothetical protein n=1 Tax=Pseudoalteromonas sp. BMB TaxID=1874619 RepID=UPI001586652C